ncbi:MAG: IS630 family transposase [Prevotellaceae bacterium]|jgi:transposase|nr:IS630 family transposase [Prevotellaceae bacterium]
MPKLINNVNLTIEEIEKLKSLTHKGSGASARSIMHANILLLTNDGLTEKRKNDREVAEMFDISPTTVNQVRKLYTTGGLEAALSRKTRMTPPHISKITGDFEAQVIAAATGPVPKGSARWTLRLLAEYCEEKKYIVSISHSAVGELLNTNEVKPHLSKYWCTPKERDADFVMKMEDVLGIYKMDYNPQIPVICMDEKPVQLLNEIRERVTAKPLIIDPETGITIRGKVEKIDSEYVRCGTASIFMFTEPLGGWRHTIAMKSRKTGDFALLMREVSDVYYHDVEKNCIVADNLNIHNKAAFYEAFEPQIAYNLCQKFEFHYTPKHGSWLNIAESELSSLSKQCLGNQRIKSINELNEILKIWEVDRNSRQKGVNWRFTTEDARIKLKRLYPTPLFS